MTSLVHHHVSVPASGGARAIDGNPGLAACLHGAPPWASHRAGSSCFALLDAARYFALPELLHSSDLPYRCLFKGAAAEELADVAPYLVKLPPDAHLLKCLLSGTAPEDPPWQMWPKRGAVFLRSSQGLAQLTEHFRHFTRLLDAATGRWNYFRFYDPAVMLTVIAQMDAPQFGKFASGVDFFAVPDGQDRLAIIGAGQDAAC